MEQIEFKQHRRTNLAELVEWNLVKTEIDLEKVSISEVDRELANENPEEFDKGFLARNPNNHNDMWYVSKKYYDENFEALPETDVVEKTLHNTTASQAAENVKDIVFWGNGNTFKLIAKASSKQEQWMKSTKAMEITGIGCVIQVTTQQGDNVAEALTFVPNTRIKDIKDEDGNVVSRQIVQ